MTDTTTYHAEYLVPGAFFSEEYSKQFEADEDWVREATRQAPPNAFCFSLYTLTLNQELHEAAAKDGYDLKPKRSKLPGKYYIDGKVHNLADIKAMDGMEILASNMECNDWKLVIKCRTGNFQPFLPEDKIVNSYESR